MGQHDPLGLSGGTRGVNNGGYILRCRQCRGCAHRRRCPRLQPLRQRHHTRLAGYWGHLVLQISHHHRVQRIHCIAGVAQALPLAQAGQDQQADLCVVKNIGNAGRVVGGVHRHRDGANLQRRLVHAHGIHTVRQPNAHTIAVAHTALLHGTPKARDSGPRLLPAVLLPGQILACKFTVCGQRRRSSYTCLQCMGQSRLQPGFNNRCAHSNDDKKCTKAQPRATLWQCL